MRLHRFCSAAALALPLAALTATAQERAIQPQIEKIVDEVSAERVRATIQKLVSFGTRNTTSSQDDPARGIGAARKWIFQQFQSYSPRLEVRYDQWRVKKNGQRIWKDTDLYNVVAVLPGKTMPDVQVIVSAHYDSLNLGAPAPPAPTNDGQTAVGERPLQVNWEKITDLDAPGACDDASGIAAVMELARVMSRYEFPKTLVFIAFAGEEQGLVGATLEAAKAKKQQQVIEAVLNNDIIGSEVSGDGRTGNSTLSVFSDDSMDSISQSLARYSQQMAERYLPAIEVNPVYMQDRLGRGGDHTPFQLEGYPAVRFSTPNEILANEHHIADTLENMSVPYTTRAAQVNAAVMASLGMAPRMPDVMVLPPPPAGAPPRPRRPIPRIARGAGYDAALRWSQNQDPNLKGYAVVFKPVGAAAWKQEIFVGNVTAYRLKGLSIDEYRFGVKAIGKDGTETPVAAFVYPPRAKVEYETIP